MIKEYLENRAKILSESIRINKEKCEHNQISITESKNTIKELENMVDEASEMFSVKAREDSGFNKKEIRNLQTKISEYMIENKEIIENTDILEKELNVIEECLKEISSDNVSRETLKNKEIADETKKSVQDSDIIEELNKSELVSKLTFCRDIAEIDGKRVVIELDNIINHIND